MPGEIYTQSYTVETGKLKPGNYRLLIQLYDKKSDRLVETGLKTDLKDNQGYFRIAEFKL